MDISQNPPGDSRTPMAFVLSALLHGVLAYAIIFGLWHFHTGSLETKPFVFEMVQGPPKPDTLVGSPTPDAAQPLASLKLPAQPFLPTHATQPVQPTVTAPPAVTQPAATTAAKPLPKPTPAQPAAPKSAVVVTTAPAPATTTKAVSYDNFIKQNPKAASGGASTSPKRASGPALPSVTVNSTGIEQELKSYARSGGNLGAGQGGTAVSQDNYIASLVKRLQDVFVAPPAYLGLTADISLTIAPNGKVVGKKIIRKSGNDAFDQAVNDALARLTFVDAPPGGQQVSFNFVFKPSA